MHSQDYSFAPLADSRAATPRPSLTAAQMFPRRFVHLSATGDVSNGCGLTSLGFVRPWPLVVRNEPPVMDMDAVAGAGGDMTPDDAGDVAPHAETSPNAGAVRDLRPTEAEPGPATTASDHTPRRCCRSAAAGDTLICAVSAAAPAAPADAGGVPSNGRRCDRDLMGERSAGSDAECGTLGCGAPRAPDTALVSPAAPPAPPSPPPAPPLPPASGLGGFTRRRRRGLGFGTAEPVAVSGAGAGSVEDAVAAAIADHWDVTAGYWFRSCSWNSFNSAGSATGGGELSAPNAGRDLDNDWDPARGALVRAAPGDAPITASSGGWVSRCAVAVRRVSHTAVPGDAVPAGVATAPSNAVSMRNPRRRASVGVGVGGDGDGGDGDGDGAAATAGDDGRGDEPGSDGRRYRAPCTHRSSEVATTRGRSVSRSG